MKKVLTMISVFLGLSVYAQSVDMAAYNTVIKQLGIHKQAIDTQFYTEKILPNDKSTWVMVFAEIAKDNEEEKGTTEYSAYIVLYDLNNKKIKAFYKEKNKWLSDRNDIQISRIWIDTGLFVLTEGVRAFGIRVESYHNGFDYVEDTDFELFVYRNNNLDRVLSNYPLGFVHKTPTNGDENDCAPSDSRKSMFSMSKNKTNGYYDIIDTITQEEITYDTNCKKRMKKTKETKTLKYNGKEYKY